MKKICLLLAAGLVLLMSGCGREDPGVAGQLAETAGSEEVAALWSEFDAVSHRLNLVRDSDDIKRLQRAYGYYLDNALWDEIADLFAEDARLEIGLDGVYVGKDRVRDYFYALGNGRSGLSDGELNEHLQLMPVVTVAPDGMTAQGRWRDIILAGQLGDYAVWGEGPFENEYVKEDGVWKISSLHWFQTMLVSFDGGWHANEDHNGAKWVSDRLPPDQPTTWPYDPWPSTFLPPFHFENPVIGVEAVDLGAFAPATERQDVSLEALDRATAELAVQVDLIEAENEIENLQRIFGFYIEEGLWSEASDLFADDGVYEIAGVGQFQGRDRVYDYLASLDDEGPKQGRLYDRMQLMPIVHVGRDGTARARWRLFAQEAKYGEFAEWGSGWYENDYVLDDGVWKIAHLRIFNRMYSPDQEGWGRTALAAPSYQAASAETPDAPSSIDHSPYPAVPEPDFHYDHPVRVPATAAADEAQNDNSAPVSLAAIEQRLTGLTDRVERVEDIEQIERLQGIYGYYLARYQMDDLAGIFSDDGTIEIALRGVYEGKASVRRNLDLYPTVDLHNHMQYQPVIHLNEAGDGANMRSRALSIMGSYDQYSMWMGGIYENEYVEEAGVWKLKKDQVFNTYFINYAEGWQNNQPRPPPGISEDNPPDSPPSMIFEMYPSAFLPPFHYANPVTGNRVDAEAATE